MLFSQHLYCYGHIITGCWDRGYGDQTVMMLTSMVDDVLDASWKSKASETLVFVIYRMLPVVIMLFHVRYGLLAVHKL